MLLLQMEDSVVVVVSAGYCDGVAVAIAPHQPKQLVNHWIKKLNQERESPGVLPPPSSDNQSATQISTRFSCSLAREAQQQILVPFPTNPLHLPQKKHQTASLAEKRCCSGAPIITSSSCGKPAAAAAAAVKHDGLGPGRGMSLYRPHSAVTHHHQYHIMQLSITHPSLLPLLQQEELRLETKKDQEVTVTVSKQRHTLVQEAVSTPASQPARLCFNRVPACLPVCLCCCSCSVAPQRYLAVSCPCSSRWKSRVTPWQCSAGRAASCAWRAHPSSCERHTQLLYALHACPRASQQQHTASLLAAPCSCGL